MNVGPLVIPDAETAKLIQPGKRPLHDPPPPAQSTPVRGQADTDQIRSEFLVGEGKMVRATRVQNTRIAALVTVHQYAIWHLTMRKHANTDDGRTRG